VPSISLEEKNRKLVASLLASHIARGFPPRCLYAPSAFYYSTITNNLLLVASLMADATKSNIEDSGPTESSDFVDHETESGVSPTVVNLEYPEACSICLCEYEGSSNVVHLPCGHIFHYECLN